MCFAAFLRFASFAAAALFASWAQGQIDATKAYPSKPIRMIVGFGAGSGTDVIARLVGQKFTEALGQPVLVDNRVGAGGIIATVGAAKSGPDGYTLLMAPSGTFTVNPVMYTKLPYSPTRDFIPISTAVTYPLFLVINSSEPMRSVKELVEYLKSNPQKANYGGSSAFFQLTLELFKLKTGTHVEFIPYKGTHDTVNAVMSGNVLMTLADAAAVTGAFKSGKARGLAVTSSTRMPFYSDIPTMAEAGFSELEIESWMGLFAPAGTPARIVRRLQEEMRRTVQLSDIKERMSSLQVNPGGNTSEEFGRRIAADLERWSTVAKLSNIKPTN